MPPRALAVFRTHRKVLVLEGQPRRVLKPLRSQRLTPRGDAGSADPARAEHGLEGGRLLARMQVGSAESQFDGGCRLGPSR